VGEDTVKDFKHQPEDFLSPSGSVSEQMIESRYPYTYACDFIRSHTSQVCRVLDIEWRPISSRAEASDFMQNELNGGDSDYEHIAIIFADAYIREKNIQREWR
jgi:hypothetical protein